MDDIFISYSRKDIAFARILNDMLKSKGLESWIDWQDIPPTADWLAEVYTAIESVNTFVFIVSKTSINSEICSKEIAHAIKNHKRLVPIVVQDVDPKAIPKEVANLNWIFFREGRDDYQASFNALLKAIRTDLDWVKAHTWLQLRALEWVKQQRNRSYLLRGKDLKNSENNMAQVRADREPIPTVLQKEFVLASRKETDKRKRLTVGISAVAIVSLILISLYGIVQFNVAANQTRIARSRQLARQALSFEGSDKTVAILLSIEAYRISDTTEARNSLLTVLQSGPSHAIFPSGNTNRISSLVISPNGKLLAFNGENSTINLWDMTNPDNPQPIAAPLTGHTGHVRSLAFHPNGSILASAGEDASIILWDVQNPSNPKMIGHPLTGHTGYITSLAFYPKGGYIASGSLDGEIIIWDISNPESPVRIANALGTHPDISSISFSPNSTKMAAASADNTIDLYDVTDIRKPWLIGIPFMSHTNDVCCIAFSPNGAILASGSKDKTLILWDAKSIFSTTLDPMGNLLFGDDYNPIAPNKIVTLEGQSSSIWSIAYHPNGNILASGDETGAIILWDVTDPSAPNRIGVPLDDSQGIILSLAFSPDGKILMAGDSMGNIFSWTFATTGSSLLISPQLLHGEGSILGFYFGKDKNIVFSVNKDKVVLEWDISNPAAPILRDVWNIDDPELPITIKPSFLDGVENNATRSDNKIKAYGGCSKFSTTRFKCVQGEIVLWDITDSDSPKQIGSPLVAHVGEVTSLAFSPDGKMLASGSEDKTIILWDVSNPAAPTKLGTELTGHKSSISSLAFNPSGDLLLSGDNLGVILIWDVNPSSWVKLACRQVGRNFTQTEWADYFSGETYRETCPQ